MCSSVGRKLLLTAAVTATLLGEGHWMQPSAAPVFSSASVLVERAWSMSHEGQIAIAANGWWPGFALAQAVPPISGEPWATEFTFPSNAQTLYACMTRPAGPGPFPVVIYNHGSEEDPPTCGPPGLVRAYVERGYLFFMFHRRGHGLSPGPYIMDRQRRIMQQIANPRERVERIVALHEEANRDVVAAVKWLMQLPEVDSSRVIMTGVSFGGIQTLLAAEKGLGLRAFIAFAPAAQSWGNEALRWRLERAVRGAQAPIFLAQAQNDYSLGPSNVLGPILRAKGAPNTAKIYPAFGVTHQQGHGGFAVRGGIPIWSPDVFAFLEVALEGRSGAAGSFTPGPRRQLPPEIGQKSSPRPRPDEPADGAVSEIGRLTAQQRRYAPSRNREPIGLGCKL
jgi:dienelactone hydrolase